MFGNFKLDFWYTIYNHNLELVSATSGTTTTAGTEQLESVIVNNFTKGCYSFNKVPT